MCTMISKCEEYLSSHVVFTPNDRRVVQSKNFKNIGAQSQHTERERERERERKRESVLKRRHTATDNSIEFY